MATTMKNLKSRKLYLQVYDELRDYITQNKLTAGDKLPTEMEMCELLGVSRNVLREAIKSLEITGIVRSKPGVGIIIQEFSTDFLFQSLFYNLAGNSESLLDQTLAVRRTLELGFLQEAFDTLMDEDIALLENQVTKMKSIFKKATKSAEPLLVFGYEFYGADATFHNILYGKTDNAILKSIIEAVWACDKYYKQRTKPVYIETTVEKHIRIVDALKKKDFQLFSNAMHYHFDVQYKTSEEILL